MSNNNRSINVFSTVIYYTVDRNSRRQNITIEISSPSQVLVKTSLRANDNEIEQVVRDNAKWILGKLADAGMSKPSVMKRRFENGEGFLFLGNEYLLNIVDATTEFPVGEVMLKGNTIAVSAFIELAKSDPLSSIRTPLIHWYKHQATHLFPQRANHYARLLGVDVRQVLIRDQKRRWGSCNSQGVLRLCYRLIMASHDVINYVIAHEVCHLREMNHSAAYWKTLSTVMPDYRTRRRELKRIGGVLVL